MNNSMDVSRTKVDSEPARVLVVDDEKGIRFSVSEFLRRAGYEVDEAEDVVNAERILAETVCDVVVSDIVLPGISGVELLRKIRQASPDVQVIMMTGEPTVETASEALRAGAADYLSKPVAKSEILNAVLRAAKIKRVRDENRRLSEENRQYQEQLECMVSDRTEQLRHALEGMISAMSVTVESRDPYTAGHQQRVADLSRAIAREMSLGEDCTLAIYYAALVHDIGKISVPAEILSNPGKLCPEAMSIIRKHPKTGSRILERVQFPWPIAEIVNQHHERLDGSGYPRGLKGDDIKLEARILAVADTVEAMATHRPYRAALGIDCALEEITSGRGKRYDPVVVDACLRLFREKGYALKEDNR